METTEMDMEKYLTTLKSEFDRFLGTYTEDSTMRVSREAFDHVVTVMQEVALSIAKLPCPGCGRVHGENRPLSKMVFMKANPEDGVLVVAIEMRSKQMQWVNKTRQQMREEMETLPLGLEDAPPAITAAFMGAFVIKPVPTTLEDLAAAGIRPFHIVQWLRLELDHRDYDAVAQTATQHHAHA